MSVPIRDSKIHDVHVFMAIRDGERWLTPQIESILNQANASVTWTITDDSSSDASLSIVKSQILQDRMTINSPQEHVGLPGVFLNMLKSPAVKSDFYALADQDDFWSPDKLDRACTALSHVAQDLPALWVSSISMPSRGKDILKAPTPHPSLGHALMEGLAPGCTMVWNAAFQEQLVIPEANKCKMHDTWIYLSACILGTVIVEPEPMVEYRIHSDNAVGHKTDVISRTRRFMDEVRGNRVSMERQAQGLLDSYGDSLTLLDKELVESVAHGIRFKRVRYWRDSKLRRHNSSDNRLLLMRLLIVLRSTREKD